MGLTNFNSGHFKLFMVKAWESYIPPATGIRVNPNPDGWLLSYMSRDWPVQLELSNERADFPELHGAGNS
jgi:hypothetical protein